MIFDRKLQLRMFFYQRLRKKVVFVTKENVYEVINVRKLLIRKLAKTTSIETKTTFFAQYLI